jgi:hypothetical protein
MDDAYLWTHQVKHLAEVGHPAVGGHHGRGDDRMAQSVLDHAPNRFAPHRIQAGLRKPHWARIAPEICSAIRSK